MLLVGLYVHGLNEVLSVYVSTRSNLKSSENIWKYVRTAIETHKIHRKDVSLSIDKMPSNNVFNHDLNLTNVTDVSHNHESTFSFV